MSVYVVGLSGGIGSGKTVASDHFASLGVTVVDTDVIARQIVEAGSVTLSRLTEEFGDAILLNDGKLSRSALREIAFSSGRNKAKLDAITHPAIRTETVKQMTECQTEYCIVVVPLLTHHSPFTALMQRILIITADEEVKIRRVQKRSNLSREQVTRIMSTQLNDTERLQFADDVIENNTDLAHVYNKVERLHAMYLSQAKNRANP